MLIVSRKPGTALLIGDQVKLGIEAPREIAVLRSEVLDTIRANAAAAGQIPEQILNRLLNNPANSSVDH